LSKPDLILYNGRIYPDAKSSSRFEALAVWKGRVTDIGSSQEILKLRARATTTINLRGKAVLPGFCDSHIHLLSYGMLLRTLDLSKTRSIEEMNRQVAKRASLMKSDEWILGRGWDDEKLREHRYPEKHDLDHSTSNPVFLKRVCGHVAVANSKALSLSGIDSDTPEPEGGVVLRDSRGAPNGVLKERALELVELAVPQSMKEIKKIPCSCRSKISKAGLDISPLHRERRQRTESTPRAQARKRDSAVDLRNSASQTAGSTSLIGSINTERRRSVPDRGRETVS